MQRFEATFIKNSCFVLHLYSSDLTDHVHMYAPSLNILRILAESQGSLSVLDTGVTFITLLTHEVFSISEFFVYFTLPEGHCLYNYSLLMYFTILGSELITKFCEHDLIVR